MDWRHWRAAKERGIKCVINPDAHSVNQLGQLKPAVQIARKGWLETGDVINCLPLREIIKLLH
jgi:DNA polymerase (family 10)